MDIDKSLKITNTPCLPNLEEVKSIFRRYAGNYHDYRSTETKQHYQERARVTIEIFFNFLSKIARDNKVHDRHWQARRDFWRTYITNGKVEDAWIVLGKKYLDDINSLPLEAKQLGYGAFINNKGISLSHCAIIMKLKNLIIVERSHSGALRIWRDRNRHAPLLGKKYYQPYDLQWNEDRRFVHSKKWQRKVKIFINNE